MEIQLSDKIKIVEQGVNAAIQYKAEDGATKNILFNTGGVYLNNTVSIMPLAYSSGFQTATLSNTFQQVGVLAFANIANFSFTSTVNGISTTIALKTA